MAQQGGLLRPVGMLEKLYVARQILKGPSSVVFTGTYAIQRKLDDASLLSFFCQIVPCLLQRHPALGSYVEAEDIHKARFMRLRSVETKDVLQITNLESQESLTEKLQELHDVGWPEPSKPLWRLVVMKPAWTAQGDSTDTVLYIAFVYNHVIGDGLSGIALHRSLLEELEGAELTGSVPQDTPAAFDVPASGSLVEPVEKLVKMPLSWSFLLSQVAQEYGPRWLVGNPSPSWAGLPPRTLEECPFRSRIRLVTVPARTLEDILRECKKQTVTLTSLLTAALLHVLADALPDAPQLTGTTPYTLRRVTGTSMDEMVNQTSALETIYSQKFLDGIRQAQNATGRAGSLWSAGRYFQTLLREELAKCPRDNLVGLLPYVSNHVDFYQKKTGKPREATWEVSNVGVFQTPDSASKAWKLREILFTQGALPFGPAFSINCASVEDGPLSISITWQDSVTEERVVDAIALGFTNLADQLRQA